MKEGKKKATKEREKKKQKNTASAKICSREVFKIK